MAGASVPDYVARFGHAYQLTNRRLFVSTGVFRRRRDQMGFRVQDVYVRENLMGRMLRVGTVAVVSTEPHSRMLYLSGVNDPKRVMDLVWHHARAERDRRSVKVDRSNRLRLVSASRGRLSAGSGCITLIAPVNDPNHDRIARSHCDMPKVTVDETTTFETPAGTKLVLAIEDAGIDILHRCGGNARCTTCRVQVLKVTSRRWKSSNASDSPANRASAPISASPARFGLRTTSPSVFSAALPPRA